MTLIFRIGFLFIRISFSLNQCREDNTNQVAIATSICDRNEPIKCSKFGYSKICTNGSLDENFEQKFCLNGTQCTASFSSIVFQQCNNEDV